MSRRTSIPRRDESCMRGLAGGVNGEKERDVKGKAQRQDRVWRATVGRTLRGLLAVACSAFAMSQAAETASAKTVQFDASFTCTTEAPCGAATSITPASVAVNEQTGDVYVIDDASDSIDVFNAEGKYLSQIPGSSTEAGSFLFGAWGPEWDDIAIDNSGGPNQGHIYASSVERGLVFAFDSTGKFLWQSSAGVASYLLGVGVDQSGNPWASDYSNGVQELNPADGSAVGTAYLKEKTSHIAFEPSGNIAALSIGGGGHVYTLPSEQEVANDDTGGGNSDIATYMGSSAVYANAVLTVEYDGVTIWDSSGKQFAEMPFGPRGAVAGVTINAANNRIYLTEPWEGKVEIYTLIPRYLLGISNTGPGVGTVTCNGGVCAKNYAADETVRLEPLWAEGSAFSGWTVNGSSSACPGTGACELTLNADTTVEAQFALEEHELSVSETGSGEVQSNPPGIACGSACKVMVAGDEVVVLSAMPAPHNHLVAWSGCDSVTAGECEVAVSADRSVSAQFAPTMRTLTVDATGTGSGTVACQVGVGPQEPCAPEYLDGSIVTVTGTPASGSTFAGFSGAGCSGTGPCVLTLSGDTALTATFDVASPETRVEPAPAAKPSGPGGEPVVPPTEKSTGAKKPPTRGNRMATAVKRCRRLPKRKRAACIKRARKKFGRANRRKGR